MTAPPQPAAGAIPPIPWSDPARAAAFDRWLTAIAPGQALSPTSVRLASADASFRRYFRIDSTDPAIGTRIVMDAPPDKENSEPFVKVAQLMAEAGVRAPQVLDWQAAHGFMLLDDLGSQTLLDVIDPARPEANLPHYLEAIDALIRWQLASRPGVLPPYDQGLLERELALFPQWYIGEYRGVKVEGILRERLERAFRQIVQTNLQSPSVYVHRDYMPRNLMVGAEGQLGVLDFQDATYGPISYDIASLLRDAFLSWDEEFVLDVTVRYWEAARRAKLPVDDDFGSFYRAVEWMGLQRHLKVAGIFARLTLRDGKPKYLADAPRFIRYIRTTAARYAQLTPLLRVIDEIEGTADATGFAFGRV
ncbi:MAG: aminoglycoside phosphotransferase [Comamonadaceae bacterium]|nr:MAG: aminoglycoside phosphotransferase [Comamonadaceae bacterium]